MARTVGNKWFVAHNWANGIGDVGRNSTSNFSFEGTILRSYRLKIAVRCGTYEVGDVYLVLRPPLSSTTSGHVSTAKRAIGNEGRRVTFQVSDLSGHLDQGLGLRSFNDDRFKACAEFNLNDYAERIAKIRGKADRARLHKLIWLRELRDLLVERNLYSRWVDMPVDDCKEELAALQVEIESWTHKELERVEAEKANAIARLERWKKGESLVSTIGFDLLPTAVRPLWADGKIIGIQTSQFAQISLPSAIKLLRLIRLGMPYRRTDDKPSYSFDGFTLDLITESGDVVIGCHRLRRDEIERVAAEIGFPPERSLDAVIDLSRPDGEELSDDEETKGRTIYLYHCKLCGCTTRMFCNAYRGQVPEPGRGGVLCSHCGMSTSDFLASQAENKTMASLPSQEEGAVR